jgi:hypothetical protein
MERLIMNTKCDTMQCAATATHRLSWVDEFEETVNEKVCEPCGQGYVTRPRLKATLEPLAPTQSGYTPCACRDCMDTTVSRNTNNPELCALCDDAGCVAWEQGSRAVLAWECQRDDAYGG